MKTGFLIEIRQRPILPSGVPLSTFGDEHCAFLQPVDTHCLCNARCVSASVPRERCPKRLLPLQPLRSELNFCVLPFPVNGSLRQCVALCARAEWEQVDPYCHYHRNGSPSENKVELSNSSNFITSSLPFTL